MTISQFAHAGQVGIETVRFYHRLGLLPLPKAKNATYRMYDQALLQQLRFIRRAQLGGFTLKEIKDLLTLDPISDRQYIQNLAQVRLTKLTTKITQLQQIYSELRQLVHDCKQQNWKLPCPIIQNLTSLDSCNDGSLKAMK